MKFFSFLNKKKYGGLINDLKIDEFWEYLSEEEREKLRQYSEPILSTYQTKVALKENESSFVIRSVTKIDDPDTNTAFHVRSASDFLTDLGDIAIKSKEYILAEKLLTESLAKNTNIFDLHYTYDKFIELYYALSDIDINFMEKCINACIKDIEVFNEIRKNTYNEYKTILKRSYKAGLILKEEYEKNIREIGPKTSFPIISAFEILAELNVRKKRYDYAIKICNQALNYKIVEEDVKKYESLIEKYKKEEMEYKKIEEEKIKNAEEIVEEKMKKIEEKIEEKIESEEEKALLKEKLEKLKKVEQKLEDKKNEKDKKDTYDLEEKLKNTEDTIKARKIIKTDMNKRIIDDYNNIIKRMQENKYFEKEELEKLKKTILKIITYWERESQEDFEIKNIIFLNSYLDYYEEKNEKALKNLEYYINICKRDEKESKNIKETLELKKLLENKILKKDFIISGSKNEEYKKYLEEANNESKNKNYDKAAYLTKKANESALSNKIELTLNEQLKLPMYLYKALRYEEAEAIFEKMLNDRFENKQEKSEEIFKIYQKMKAMYNAKKNNNGVLKSSIYSYIWQGIFYSNTDKEKYMKHSEYEMIKSFIEPLISKTNKNQNLDKISKYIENIISNMDIDMNKTEDDINNLIIDIK